MMKLVNWLIVFSLLLGLLVACAPVEAPSSAPTEAVATEPVVTEPVATEPVVAELVHLRVGVFNFVSFSPFFIAREEGYFAEQGLDVELVDFGSTSNEIIPALVARKLDVAGPTLSAAVFNAILEGNNLKYVADKGFINPENCATDAWVASKTLLDSGTFTDPSMIKGKNVTFPPGGTIEYTMDVLLAQNGLSQSDITATNVADSAARVEGLKNGSIDVSVLSEPWITRAQTSDAGDIWVPFSDIVPNLSLGSVVFGPGILEDKPEAGKRFMIAYLKAVEQFNQGKTDRNVELIATFTKLAPEDIKASCWTSFQPDGKMNTETLLAFQEWAVKKGYIDNELKLEQFWTSEFVDEALKVLGK